VSPQERLPRGLVKFDGSFPQGELSVEIDYASLRGEGLSTSTAIAIAPKIDTLAVDRVDCSMGRIRS